MTDSLTFPVPEAQLTSLFLSSIFYGILLVTFGFCLHALLSYNGRLRTTSEIHWLMLSVTILAFIIGTFDLALNYYNNLKAFVFYTGKGGAMAEFANISDWVNVTKSVCMLAQTLLGDAMLIYRCWTVWGCTFSPVLASSTLWCGACSMAIWIIYMMSTLHTKVFIHAKQLQPAGIAFWALSINLNILTTGLLVYRIWSVRREHLNNQTKTPGIGSRRTNSLDQIIRYIIESGLLYTMISIATFITVVTKSNGSYPVSCIEIMIVPIAFNLIIIRTSRIGHDEGFTTRPTNGTLQFDTGPRTVDTDAQGSTMLHQDGVGRSLDWQSSLEKHSP